MKKAASQTLVLLVLFLMAGSLALAFFFSHLNRLELIGWRYVIYQCMLFYLIFVIIRSAILIILSFGEYYFRHSLEAITHFPFVSIIVPCYNEQTTIKNAINCLAALDYPNYEVLIIDDGSTDLTFDEAINFASKNRFRVITQENAGKANALNRGISEALGEYVLCMDADSLLAPNVIKTALAYFEKKPSLCAVAGNVMIGNPDKILTMFQRLEYVVSLNFHKTSQSFLSMVTIIPGPIGVFRKSALLKVGGYNDDTYAEDCDLSMRLLIIGEEIAYCPEMIAYTEAPTEILPLISQRYRWARGVAQAIIKNSKWLVRPHVNFRNFCVLHYMLLESITISTINFIFAFCTLYEALTMGTYNLYGPFFIGLTILDTLLATYNVILERNGFRLAVLSLINRITYAFSLEIIRFYSLIDELFSLPMKWGVLERKGMDGLKINS